MASSTKDTLTSGPGRFLRIRLSRIRVVTAAILGALALFAGVSTWRMRSLADLPDIGDPFDVERARQAIKIPDSDNAFEAYAKASLTPGDAPPEFWAERSNKQDALRWSTAKPTNLAYLEKHRRALEIWRLGSERADCLPYQPAELSAASIINFVPESMVHAAMAALEGSRLKTRGRWPRPGTGIGPSCDRAGCWAGTGWRSSGISGRIRTSWLPGGSCTGRRIPGSMPGCCAALDEALAADRLTAPLSEMLKLEYLIIMRELKEMRFFPRDIPLPGGKEGLLENAIPTWRAGIRNEIQQFRFRASNEPERSRRALRLIFANWLSQVDKPAAKRAPFSRYAGVLIYDVDQAYPPAARGVTPEDLGRAIEESLLAKSVLSGDGFVSWEGDGGLAPNGGGGACSWSR